MEIYDIELKIQDAFEKSAKVPSHLIDLIDKEGYTERILKVPQVDSNEKARVRTVRYVMLDVINVLMLDDSVKAIVDSNSDLALDLYEEERDTLAWRYAIHISQYAYNTVTNTLRDVKYNEIEYETLNDFDFRELNVNRRGYQNTMGVNQVYNVIWQTYASIINNERDYGYVTKLELLPLLARVLDDFETISRHSSFYIFDTCMDREDYEKYNDRAAAILRDIQSQM